MHPKNSRRKSLSRVEKSLVYVIVVMVFIKSYQNAAYTQIGNSF